MSIQFTFGYIGLTIAFYETERYSNLTYKIRAATMYRCPSYLPGRQ